MMVMRRRSGESILIGEHIRIVIAEAGRNRVKLVIDAPRELVISAQEIREAQSENRVAATVQSRSVLALAEALRNAAKNSSNPASPVR